MSSIHIVSTGVRTPLGLNSPASAAARRAGIGAACEHPFMVDRCGDPMTVAIDKVLPPTLAGTPRMLALAEPALREACAVLDEAGLENARIPLLLALPELRPGFSGHDAHAIRDALQGIEGLPVQTAVQASPHGHAAGLALLAMAAQQLRQGASELCLVGGVDSYLEPDTMDWLDANRQLAGAMARSAFVPGEGAGFCLLASSAACERLGLQPLMTLRTTSVARETKLIKSDDISLGEGLTTVVKSVAAQLTLPQELIMGVICDINGERYRGEEWGFVCLRAGACFDDPTSYWAPADVWGDMGAASGPLFAMLACEGARRGYAPGPRTLLWASSEQGLRAAALLECTIGARP